MQIPPLNHIVAIALPLLLRSIAHHLYHKTCHYLIHVSGHRFHAIGHLLAKSKWLTDVLLVACLTCFGAVTEHEPDHETEPDHQPVTDTKE